jgi:hypothetical protein
MAGHGVIDYTGFNQPSPFFAYALQSWSLFMKSLVSVSLSIFILALCCAADWPQWRGPNRDGVSSQTGLNQPWSGKSPKLLWTSTEAGIGYGGPAIVGKTVFIMGSEQDATEEFVLAIDISTGKRKWKTPTKIAQPMRNFNADWGGGPRSTPTVDGDRLFVIGVHGDLSCLETGSGQVIWHKSLTKDLGGKAMGIWGFCESPLVDGDVVVCSPGYDDKNGQAGVAALDKKTGEIKWQSKDLTDQASYSSLVISEGAGIRQYVGLTKDGGFSVRASDGKLLWKNTLGKNRVAVIPTPIVSGDVVYFTSDYGAGSGSVKLSKSGDKINAEELFANKDFENHHGGIIQRDGCVFGSNGNANNRKVLPFVCQDIETGKVLWSQQSTLEPSSIVFADGRFYCYGQMTGAVVRVAASKTKFEKFDQFTIPKTSDQRKSQGGIWTHPVIADGKLFLRDQELIFCYDLKGQVSE